MAIATTRSLDRVNRIVHASTPKAIQQAVRTFVSCIEHAQLADEEGARADLLLVDGEVYKNLLAR